MCATQGTAASVDIGKKQAENSDFTGQSALLGSVAVGPKGEKHRLVRLNKAAGLTAPAIRARSPVPVNGAGDQDYVRG